MGHRGPEDAGAGIYIAGRSVTIARMQRDLIELVDDFRAKFGLATPDEPTLDVDKLAFRFDHLTEELNELKRAGENEDLAEAADALIDLIYVALGACADLGLPTRALFEAVHDANMQKVRAKSADESKRHSTFDVVKPPGWQAADIEAILEEARV